MKVAAQNEQTPYDGDGPSEYIGYIVVTDDYLPPPSELLPAWRWTPGGSFRSIFNGTWMLDHGGWFEIPEDELPGVQEAMERDIARLGEPASAAVGTNAERPDLGQRA